jgi:hypothetical protein
MADAGLFIGWGQVVRGREERALDVFNETVAFYVALLDPHGGELAGFAMLRGSEDQIDAVHRAEDFLREMAKASLIVDDLGIIDAAIGEGLGRAISIYQEQLAVVA